MNIFKIDPFVDLANVGLDTLSSSMNFSGMITSVGSMNSYPGLNGIITSIQEGVQPIGMALLVLFFLFSIFSDAMNETFSFERFVKSFARLFAGMALVTLSKDMTDLGDYIATWTQDAIGEATSPYKAPTHFTNEDFGSFWQALLAAFLIFLLGNFCGLIIRIVFYFILFSRLMEMAVRASFMPIAIGLVTDGGWSGSAGRYIKKYVALCIQGPALVLIGQLSANIMGEATSMAMGGDGLTGIAAGLFQLGGMVPMIAVAVATIGLAKQSITILNDVLGV